MGSTGSGSFSDYSGSSSKKDDNGGGGSSGEDRCDKAFACVLEEVEQCEYYGINQGVPPADTPLFLELRGRVMAVDPHGASVGALPTRFNFLADCLNAGFTYEGRIVASTTAPVASVNVDFAPSQP